MKASKFTDAQKTFIINRLTGHYKHIIRGLDRGRHRPFYVIDPDDTESGANLTGIQTFF